MTAIGWPPGVLSSSGVKTRPEGRANAEHRKVSSGDEFAVHALSLSVGADAQRGFPAAEHSAKDLVVIAEILVHGIGDLVAAIVAAVVLPAAPQQHKLLRILDREQAQEELVDQRENSGIGADAQGQRKHRDGNEDG